MRIFDFFINTFHLKGVVFMSKTKKLTTSALLVAMSAVLTFISKVIPAPWFQGGAVTLGSMVPIIAIAIMFGTKWGIVSGLVYSVLNILIMGFYPPPTQTFLNFAAVVLLDYAVAFGVLGLAGTFYKLLGKKVWAIPISGAIVTTLRYISHIVSGILIWGVYAEEGQSVLAYAVLYNGSFMIPEIIITTVVLALLSAFLQKQIRKAN